MWKDSLPISKFRFGYIDNKIKSSLLNDMKIHCNESLYIYHLLLNLPDDEIAIAQPWATKGMIREEISSALLQTATSIESNVCFAIKAVSLICIHLGISDALILIVIKDLLERPNFLCAMVIFNYLQRIAKDENNSAVLDSFIIFQNPENNIFRYEDRKNIFLDINSCSSLSKLIHNTYEKKRRAKIVFVLIPNFFLPIIFCHIKLLFNFNYN